ncbi:YceI family protein [Fulvivirgaceae bacterium BMA10]|uniref:YceI family protein n=1 Tax=Splendidivirga corallicola TaxID=3051826 RepID=A0ABT8KQE2_9BACT|nr:YceI family protein [Fulvivirgaceae bacterium BMA10]
MIRLVQIIVAFSITLSAVDQSFSQAKLAIQKEKSDINFSVKNFGINTGGTLSGLEGDIQFDTDQLEKSYFDIKIPVKSINTNNKARDKHLLSDDYFDVEQYSWISFKTTEIVRVEDGFSAKGNLTIKNISRTIALPFTYEEHNNEGIFKAKLKINRLNFKVGKSSWVLGNEVKIDVEVVVKK